MFTWLQDNMIARLKGLQDYKTTWLQYYKTTWLQDCKIKRITRLQDYMITGVMEGMTAKMGQMRMIVITVMSG